MGLFCSHYITVLAKSSVESEIYAFELPVTVTYLMCESLQYLWLSMKENQLNFMYKDGAWSLPSYKVLVLMISIKK